MALKKYNFFIPTTITFLKEYLQNFKKEGAELPSGWRTFSREELTELYIKLRIQKEEKLKAAQRDFSEPREAKY